MRWQQSRVVLVVGWELFLRRQDLPRLQPCDVRVGEKGMQVLIRYAKNDTKGLTRAPFLQRNEDERACPVTLLQQYMQTAGITVHKNCNKVWGQPFPCDHCPPLFPSITKTHGKREHAMPNARVTDIVRELYGLLAEAGHIEAERAKEFTAKSMRCGGVSSAAAACVRAGVIHGHGGWFDIESQKHYDVMKTDEVGLVSQKLGTELSRCMGGEGASPKPPGARTALPKVPGAPMTPPTSRTPKKKEYVVKEIKQVKIYPADRRILVLWEPCEDNDYAIDESTWEWERDLREDGLGPMLDKFDEQQPPAGK